MNTTTTWVGLAVATALAVLAIECFDVRTDEGSASERPPGWVVSAAATDGWRVLEGPAGERVLLDAPPQRIVAHSIAAHATLLQILHDPERLVGHTRLSADTRYSPIARDPRAHAAPVGDGAESIATTRPDLVFTASFASAETIRQLRSMHIPTIPLGGYDSLDGVLANLRFIGRAVGEDEAAEQLIVAVERDVRRARQRVEASRPRGAEPLRILAWSEGSTPGQGTLFADLVETLGATNLPSVHGIHGWRAVSSEQVAQWDPDVILVPTIEAEQSEALRAVREHPALATTAAVRRGAVYPVDAAAFTAVSHHVVRLIDRLASVLMAARHLPVPSV